MKQEEKEIKQSLKRYTFGRTSLFILLASLVLVLVGYMLMSGGTSDDGISFNPDVFSFRRIKVAPIVCTIGYLGVIVAIFYREKGAKQ